MARDLLAEGRDAFRRFELDVRPYLLLDENRMLLFPWRGTVATRSLALALVREGLTASPHQVAIEVAGEYEKINGVLKVLSQQTAPDPIELAACVRNLVREKFHPYLNRSLQARDMASSEINSAPIPDLASRMIHR